MSTEEERTVVSDVENAKKSDETSTAGEHNLEKNDQEKLDEQQQQQQQSNVESEIRTDEIKPDDSNIINEKVKIIESLTDIDQTNIEKPNEELTVV